MRGGKGNRKILETRRLHFYRHVSRTFIPATPFPRKLKANNGAGFKAFQRIFNA